MQRETYLAQRREALTPDDLEALWRMTESENPREPDSVKVEMVWAVINRAYERGVPVRQLLMPKGIPSHQIGGNPPFSTWRPVGKDGNPAPSSPNAAQMAETWVASDPELPDAIEWFEPKAQDQLAAQGTALRTRRDAGASLTPHETQIALYKRTADQFRADRPGKSLGQVGPLEFFRV